MGERGVGEVESISFAGQDHLFAKVSDGELHVLLNHIYLVSSCKNMCVQLSPMKDPNLRSSPEMHGQQQD